MRRLDQLLANLGYCSRREARGWIQAGRVTVRGVTEKDFGAKANPAEVQVDGAPLDHPDGLLLLLHKPVGLVCSHDEREGPNVYRLLPRVGANATPWSPVLVDSIKIRAGCCCSLIRANSCIN